MVSPFEFNNYIYFVYNKNTNLIKIGQTKYPKDRMRQLQKEVNTSDLVYLGVFVDTLMERGLHRHFVKDRVGHEWFKISDELLELIQHSNFVGYLLQPCDIEKAKVYGYKLGNRLLAYERLGLWITYCLGVIDIRLTNFVEFILEILNHEQCDDS